MASAELRGSQLQALDKIMSYTVSTSASAMTAQDEALALVTYPGLLDLGKHLPATHPSGGYPELLLFAVLCCARIWRSQNRALNHLRSGSTWQEMLDAYAALTGNPGPYPALPPTAQICDRFLKQKLSDPGAVEALGELFLKSSVAFAKSLGHFASGVTPDLTRIEPAHLIVGDGTYVRPFSNVREEIDKATGEIITYGSRATVRPPRVQRMSTDASSDGKSAVGINHVSILATTPYGWIVLAVTQALGSEVRSATPLIDQVAHEAGDGLHTVVWDGAYSGISKEALTARHGVMVLTKPGARPNESQQDSVGFRLDSGNAIERFRRDHPLPLGTSVFNTSKGYEMVRTRVYRYGLVTGTSCRHELWTDGDALVEVHRIADAATYRALAERGIQPDSTVGSPIKVGKAEAVFSTRHQHTNGDYGITTKWRLACSVEGEHVFTTTSQPRRDHKNDLHPSVRAINTASPVSRTDTDAFATAYGHRNLTESFNSWFKGRLGTSSGKNRAMRLNPRHQAVDHLCVALLANAITYRRMRQAHRG